MNSFFGFPSLKTFFSLILISSLGLTGCNHLLYPADREAFVKKELIVPEPIELMIPIADDKAEPYLHAWLFKSKSQKPKALIIHFHGNGQNLTTHFMFFRWLIDYNYDYLIFDYRGYGLSSDKKASQEKTIQDGLAVFHHIEKHFKNVPVIAIGQSLGGNVLARTLQEMNQQKKKLPVMAVFDSTFLSYKNAGSSVLSQRWFLYPLKPLAYILIDDTWSAKKEVDQSPPLPALFFHGTKDPIIKYHLGTDAYNRWPGPKHFMAQDGGFHTSAFGDKNFIHNRPLILSCFDSVLKIKGAFENCLSLRNE